MIQSAAYVPPGLKEQVSDLKVLKSAAGYYIGTTIPEQFGSAVVDMPASRDSDYFDTEGEAAAFLALIEGEEQLAGALLRPHP